MKRLLLLGFFISIMCHPGCKCHCDDPSDPECKNYDPCYGVEEPTANFIVREQDINVPLPPYSQPDPCDTLIAGGVEFIASYRGPAEYHWKIWNSSKDYTNASFVLDFKDYLSTHPQFYETPAKITLMVIPKGDNSCFPGIPDTLISTRNIVFFESGLFPRYYKIRGEFSSDPGKQHELYYYTIFSPNPGVYDVFFNLPGVDDTLWIRRSPDSSLTSYKQDKIFYGERFYAYNKSRIAWGSDSLVEVRSEARFSPDGHHRFHIDYYYTPDNASMVHYTFDGMAY